MFTNYLKIAFRNLRRNSLRSLIHILGLSLGIAICFLIFNLVVHSYSYDKFHPDLDRIYRINTLTDWGEGGSFPNSGTPGPLGEVIDEEISGVDKKGRLYTLYQTQVVKPNTKRTYGRSNLATFADPGFFEIFPREWLAGTVKTALAQPNAAVISESSLNRYFPGSEADDILGEELLFVDSDSIYVQITGVVSDYDENTDFKFTDFISFSTIQSDEQKNWYGIDQWGSVNSSSQLFVKVTEGTKGADLDAALMPLVEKYFAEETEYATTFSAEHLSELHFSQNYSNDQVSKTFLNGLIFIGIIILLLATLNFINLETAQAVTRAKEVGIRKTIGGSRVELISQFLTETFLLVLLSLALAMMLGEGLRIIFQSYFPAEFNVEYLFWTNICFYILFPLLLTLISGIYPALVLSGYEAQRALKGEMGKGAGFSVGTFLRKNLTVLQFSTSIAFIILVLVLQAQLRFVSSQPLGFDREAILYSSLPFMSDPDDMLRLQNRLNQESAVRGASLSGSLVSSTSLWTSDAAIPRDSADFEFFVQVMNVDSAFVEVNGIPLLAGSDKLKGKDEIVVNESFIRATNIGSPEEALSQEVRHADKMFKIIGVIGDFHSRTLREEIRPMLMKTEPTYFQTVSVKLQSDQNLSFAKENLEAIYASIYPNEEVAFKFLDQEIERFYAEDLKIRNVLGFACGLAILISCMGLFGLSSFTIAQRTKEISIRKVLGASLQQILFLISKEYILLVGIAFLIAIYPAYYFLSDWLSGFHNRIDMPYEIYVVSGFSVLAVCLLIVGIHSYSASTTNPAKVLKSE